MREILFRGKGDTQYNDGDWYYGVPIYDGKNWQICTDFSKRVVSPDTISQFIGIHDKNSEKIFEGDIVKGRLFYEGEKERILVVKYHFYDTSYYFVGADKQPYKSSSLLELEKVGNIWDNPELLL